MRICLFAEGSYPYVLGGVSSWINSFIGSCPEHEFVVYAICAETADESQYKYKIPKNVVEIRPVYLDQIQLDSGKKGVKYKIDKTTQEALVNLLRSNDFSWSGIFMYFDNASYKNVDEFFMSRDFFNMVKEVYKLDFQYTPFTEFIWTMRSMYLPLFHMMIQKLPEADLYHTVSTGYAGVLASYAKHKYKKPVILSEHGIYTREREEEIIKSSWIKGYYKDLWIKFFYNFSRCAYDSADLVTSLFETSRSLQVDIGCPMEKQLVISNGVKVHNFKDLSEKEDETVINIGAVVRVVPIKDLKTMIRSFELVKREVPEAHFYIMGPAEEDPEYLEECQKLLTQLNVKDVNITGTINVRDYIGKMDVMVLTSISEGQPLAVMEGMAAKRAHVCTDVGDCRGLLFGVKDHYGQAGYVEHVMNHHGIAKSIIKLCRNKELRIEFGENGYQRVKNLYQHEMVIDKYKEVYLKYGSEEYGRNRI